MFCFVVETGSHHVGQVDLELNTVASASPVLELQACDAIPLRVFNSLRPLVFGGLRTTAVVETAEWESCHCGFLPCL